MSLPFDVYIKFQTDSIVYREVNNEKELISCTNAWCLYLSSKYPQHDFMSAKGFNEQVYEIMSNEEEILLRPQMHQLIKLSVILETISFIDRNLYIKRVKTLIYFNYFLCWLFVLTVSLKTLDIHDLTIMLENTWITIPNPFSSP